MPKTIFYYFAWTVLASFAALFVALIFVPIPAFGNQKPIIVELLSLSTLMLVLLSSHPRRLFKSVEWRGTKPTLIFLVPVLVQIVVLFFEIVVFPNSDQTKTSLLASLSQSTWIVLLFVYVVLAPITEELFFRSWMWDDLKAKGVDWGIVPATTLLWLFAHLGRPLREMVFLFVLGFVYAMARWVSNGIVLGAVLHAANNFLVVASAYVAAKNL